MKKFTIKMRGAKKAEIFIYDEIGDSWFGGVSAKQFVQDLSALGTLDEISVRIHSDGGSVFDGVTIYNALARNPAKIITHCDGLAASISSLIYMSGDERHIAENATLMIHDPWTIAAGSADELRNTADLLEQVRSQIISGYMGGVNITRDEVSDLMTAETWMTADQALEYGFATNVSEEMKVAACYDLSKFRHPPENLSKIQETKQPPGVACDAVRKMRAVIADRNLTASGQN